MSTRDSGYRYRAGILDCTANSPTSKGPNRPNSIERIITNFPKSVSKAEKLRPSPSPNDIPTMPMADVTSNMMLKNGFSSVNAKARVNSVIIVKARMHNTKARTIRSLGMRR